MTPNELLELAASQFQVMYVEPARRTNYLKQALGAYQDKAGVLRKLSFAADSAMADIPDDYLALGTAADADGIFHELSDAEGKLVIAETSKSKKPYEVYYYANLRDWDLDTALPAGESLSLILDYLTALIAIPNTARERQVAIASGLQAELPTDEELRARKENLETAMEERQAIIPMVTVS